MNQLDYSSSSDTETPPPHAPSKRKPSLSPLVAPTSAPAPKKRLPPPILPDSLTNRYKAKVESDLSAKAGGKRIEFVPGNWATVVYISVIPTDDLESTIETSISTARSGGYPTFRRVETMQDGGLHISLSRTIFLKEFQIQSFVKALKDRLEEKSSFGISFSKFNTYLNEDFSKTFLSMDVGSGFSELESLTMQVDSALKAFSQPSFYE
ncbi:poly(U)-specific 3'-to-5' RNA exonuclease, partial [Podochytrium sp. JEL0797]